MCTSPGGMHHLYPMKKIVLIGSLRARAGRGNVAAALPMHKMLPILPLYSKEPSPAECYSIGVLEGQVLENQSLSLELMAHFISDEAVPSQ